jgi:hypothetical protein
MKVSEIEVGSKDWTLWSLLENAKISLKIGDYKQTNKYLNRLIKELGYEEP